MVVTGDPETAGGIDFGDQGVEVVDAKGLCDLGLPGAAIGVELTG